MAYIIVQEPVRDDERWTVDLWKDCTKPSSLYEWYERPTREEATALIATLLGRGHVMPPDESMDGYFVA